MPHVLHQVPCVGGPCIRTTRAIPRLLRIPSHPRGPATPTSGLVRCRGPIFRIIKGPAALLCGLLEPLGFGMRVSIATIRGKFVPHTHIRSNNFVLQAMMKDPTCLRVPQRSSAHQGHEGVEGPEVQREVLPPGASRRSSVHDEV